MCRAFAFQVSVRKFESLWQPLLRGTRDQLRLVKAALSAFAGVQRHGYNQRPEIFAAALELRDRLGQHATQHGRSRQNLVVFQQMDQPAQRSGIFAERHSAVEFRLEIAAALAVSLAHQQLRGQQPLAALHALRHANRLNGIQTLLAHRKTRNVYKGDTAEPAIGREEDRKNTTYCRNNRRDEGTTLPGALNSSLSN